MRVNRQARRARGSVLAFVIAVFIGIILVFAMFSLSFNRLLGSHEEQKTAIEAAALAAARDLSVIVVDDPYFGYIGLSDRPPTGTATAAKDGYYLPVEGINTLFATIRLDMIVADKLNDSSMKQFAQRDYQNALAAKDRLAAELQQSLSATGFGLDADGNRIEPYKDAVAAYTGNSIRMAGSSALVPNTMKLTLGWEDQLTSNMPLPQPASAANVPQSAQENGNFKPFTNIPFQNVDFVFTAGSNETLLVDNAKFQKSPPGLPYYVLDIVKCEADQKQTIKDEHANDKVVVTHCSACAQPFTVIDPLPAPGALELSFPYGRPPEIGKLSDIFLYQGVVQSPADRVETVSGDDFPPNPLTEFSLPVINNLHPRLGQIMSLAFYDWLRRGRSHVDMNSLIQTLNKPLPPTAGAQKYQFQVSPDGTIAQTVQPEDPNQDLVISDQQYWAVSGLAVYESNTKIFDVFLRDFVFQPGKTRGGIHAGEPLDKVGVIVPGVSTGGKPLNEHPVTTKTFSTGSGVRPTYQTMGTAVQIKFKTH